MRQVQYVKYNKLRMPEFQTRTSLCQDLETGRRYVEKSAVREQGREHILKFPGHCRQINECFLNVEALDCEIVDGAVRYDWLEGQDYGILLFDSVRQEGDIAGCVKNAVKWVFAVKPGGEALFQETEGFRKVFGREAGKKVTELLPGATAYSASNIDMTFDNIMVCGGKYYCLDYEWTVDFPVPAAFIQYRSLNGFYHRFENYFSSQISRGNFLRQLGIGKDTDALFAGMEEAFQSYVHGEGCFCAYTMQYEKHVKTRQEIRQDAEEGARYRELLEHQIEEYKNALQLKENHIQNQNVMIAEREAIIHKYDPLKKAAKMVGGKQAYRGLKTVYKAGAAAGNKIFPKKTGRRDLLHNLRQAAAHPQKAKELLFSVKKGKVLCGDQELDDLYYELGALRFRPVEKPRVSIIIPVYNQVRYTYRCLASILANTRDVSYEVILADDVSTDGTRLLSRYIKGLRIVRNEANLGFLKNCNRAAKRARGKYLFFLNNDTQVKPGWLSSLVTLIESDPTIGMVGSKLVYPDGRLQEAGGILWKEGDGWNYGKFDDPDKPEYNYVKDVDFISGAAIMLSRGLWRQIGGFDQRFAPAYCEDADLAFEVRKRGLRVVYQPLSVVVHYEGISNGTDTSKGVKAYQVANLKKLKEKWAEEFEKQEAHGEDPNPFAARERLRGRKVILAVDHYVPTFDKDAGSNSVFQYLKMFIRKGYVVKFIGDNYGHEEPYTTVLQQMGIEVLYGAWYRDHIFQWIEKNRDYIDYAYLNRPHIAVKYVDFLRRKTDIKLMYYGTDLHFVRKMREYEVTGDESHKKESEYMKRQELALIRKMDMSYYPSYVERDILHGIDRNLRVKAIPLNIFESFKEDIDFDFTKRRGLMFVGGFAHQPNQDGVLWFVREVYPLIRKELEVPFYIVGSHAPEAVQRLDGKDGVVVKGFISGEELEKLYASCQAVVVPLRFGAGVKGKVIEALYNGMPTVTTSIGAEGIEGVERVLAVADTAEDFAKRTLEFCRDPGLSAETGKRAAEFVKSMFSLEAVWDIVKDDFHD